MIYIYIYIYERLLYARKAQSKPENYKKKKRKQRKYIIENQTID